MYDGTVFNKKTKAPGHCAGSTTVNRRRALARLGLTAAAIYVAPILLALTPASLSMAGLRGWPGKR